MFLTYLNVKRNHTEQKQIPTWLSLLSSTGKSSKYLRKGQKDKDNHKVVLFFPVGTCRFGRLPSQGTTHRPYPFRLIKVQSKVNYSFWFLVLTSAEQQRFLVSLVRRFYVVVQLSCSSAVGLP